MQGVYRYIFACLGWKIEGKLPKIDKFLFIIAPHTSNWDFVILHLARATLKLNTKFLVKHQAFFFPLKYLLRYLGGIPVYRDQHNNVVAQAVTMFNNEDKLILGIAPEGTRSPVTRWHVGFYYIALKAKVPIVMLSPDYQTKSVCLSNAFEISGDIEKDFVFILHHFRQIHGRYPKDIPDFKKEPD